MNTEFLAALFLKYRTRGLLIDSSLLLMWLLGRYDVSELARFKRTKKYTAEDFQLLSRVVEYFDAVVTTPNILTEVSNLAGQLSDDIRFRYFATWQHTISTLAEKYTPSAEASRSAYLPKLGLTDTGIILGAPSKYLVLTDDFPLSNTLRSSGFDVVNFNHLRTLTWGLG